MLGRYEESMLEKLITTMQQFMTIVAADVPNTSNICAASEHTNYERNANTIGQQYCTYGKNNFDPYLQSYSRDWRCDDGYEQQHIGQDNYSWEAKFSRYQQHYLDQENHSWETTLPHYEQQFQQQHLDQNDDQWEAILPQYHQQHLDQDERSSLAKLVHPMAQLDLKAQQETEKFEMETRRAMDQVAQITATMERLAEKQEKQLTQEKEKADNGQYLGQNKIAGQNESVGHK